MELDFNLNLMEGEQQQQLLPPPAPPPPPPPPPPPGNNNSSHQQHQESAMRRATNNSQPQLLGVQPAPLPGPPPHISAAAAGGLVGVSVAGSVASLSPLQFVLPTTKTNQQILLAKQQLESQLAGPPQPASIPAPSVRAGPKGGTSFHSFLRPPPPHSAVKFLLF
jgi:hypothetical protein